jgi:hypothetical protein
MIPLSGKPNTVTPNSTYPFGDILDNPGDNTGTPVNRKVYSDIHQFFEKLFNDSELTANNLPDNATNGFQLFEAFITSGNKNFVMDFIQAIIGPYTANDLIVLWGCTVTKNIPGTSSVTQGAIFYNDIIYKVDLNNSISSPSNTLVWKINSSVQPNKIYLANGVSNSGIADYAASNVKYLFSGLPIYRTSGGVESLIPMIKKKVIEIGDWNMDVNGNPINTTYLGISDVTKVISVSVLIRKDDDSLVSPLGIVDGTSGVCAGRWILNKGVGGNPYLTLLRITGGEFDNSDYSATSFNRGWVMIEYQS